MIRLVFSIIFLPLIIFSQANIDSAISQIHNTKSEIERASLYLFIAENSADDAEWKKYNALALSESEKLLKNNRTQSIAIVADIYAKALNNEGYILLQENKIYEANNIFKNAIEIRKEYNIHKGLADIYSNAGAAMENLGRLNKAIDNYLLAIKEEDRFPNPEVRAVILNNLATIYDNLSNSKKALEYYEKSIKCYEEINNPEALFSTYINLSTSYYNSKNNKNAIYYIRKALLLADSTNLEHKKLDAYDAIGLVFINTNNPDSASVYIDKTIQLALSQNNFPILASGYYAYGYMQHKKGDYKLASNYFNRSYQIFDSINDLQGLRTTVELMKVNCDSLNDYKNSNKYLQKLFDLKENLYKSQLNNSLLNLELQLDFDKKEAEYLLKQAQHETEINNQKFIKNFLIAGSAFLLILSILIYINLKNSQKARRQLSIKNNEIQRQKKLVVEKQNEMISSINYAQRIQSAILTGEEVWKRISKSYFIFYQPKDIISGDFYWAHVLQNGRAVFAVADCTGHGVPGGLMSMLGNSFLNEIVVENKIFNAAIILNKLREKVIKSLEQKGIGDTHDGMDIALCVWNKMDNSLDFAGANNGLLLMRNAKVQAYAGNKIPIGTHINDRVPFVGQTIQLQKGDTIYLTSDGFPDQFGGPETKKYKTSQLKTVLEALSDISMDQQHEILKQDFANWKGNHEQTDDVCLIGIKLD
ncbi:MAG: tetratricopeptide repeat protein [Sphingobacteriaceae bacterium]|nr:tetratricopeptide repeat protein [Sphingobacteriaceae bacterium]